MEVLKVPPSKTAENVKMYNKKYYAMNRDKILSGIARKTECPRCKRVVNHQNMNKHQKSKICTRRYKELLKEKALDALLTAERLRSELENCS